MRCADAHALPARASDTAPDKAHGGDGAHRPGRRRCATPLFAMSDSDGEFVNGSEEEEYEYEYPSDEDEDQEVDENDEVAVEIENSFYEADGAQARVAAVVAREISRTAPQT